MLVRHGSWINTGLILEQDCNLIFFNATGNNFLDFLCGSHDLDTPAMINTKSPTTKTGQAKIPTMQRSTPMVIRQPLAFFRFTGCPQ